MSTKYIVKVYSLTDEIVCDDEGEADDEMDRQDRIYGNLTRLCTEERDDEDEDGDDGSGIPEVEN